MWHALAFIEKRLKVDERSSSWQVNPMHYLEANNCFYKPGTLSAAFAWFQQAMEVINHLETF